MAFHVPALARDTTHPLMRSDRGDGNNGLFMVESPEPSWTLWCIASDGSDWEHVSVHAHNGSCSRIPNWREMVYVKRLFWDDEDVAVQFHPRRSEYVNCHPHVLHIWRPTRGDIPTPPPELIGPLMSRA